jgi:hypothetical protein
MDIGISRENGRVPVVVMHVNGSLDSSTYEAFEQKAEELMAGGARHLLIDLGRAPFVSSAGLRALNAIFNRLRELSPDGTDEDMRRGITAGTYKSPHLKLLNPSESSRVALETSGFSMFIDDFSDLKKAIASF